VIVISGALVLVALILLIVGITLPELTYVYASILVSLVSFAFLIIGILQRRGDKGGSAGDGADRSAPASVPAVREEPTVSVVAAPARTGGSVVVGDEPAPATQASELDDLDDAEYDDEEIDPADDRAVIIVAGRPRYHAEGCRYLNGKQTEAIHLLDARDEGYTPCGVCKPDNVVAVEGGLAVVPAEEGVDPVVDVVPASAVDDVPAAAAPPGPADSGTVVIIPDRGRFHRSACRYVKNATDTRTRTRTQAVGEGYVPCGVCKP
jgi:hypothetical protein